VCDVCLERVDLELVVVICVLAASPVILIGGRWHAASLFNRDPYEVFGALAASTESVNIMIVTGITTVCCVAVPIRSHLSWVLPTWAVCIFCALTMATSSPHPGALPVHLLLLCVLNSLLVFAGFQNERHLRKEWLAQRQVEKHKDISEKQKHCFSHLLNRLCDCLFQLGPNLEIMEPCPNLAAMLFLTDGRPLQGSCFCDYLAREDQERFVAALGRHDFEAESSGILPLHLRDAQRCDVQVHVYYTSFRDEDGSPYHIIGIVEAGGRTSVGESASEEADVLGITQSTNRLSNMLADKAVDKSSDTESEITLESVNGADVGEVAVTFEDDAGLKIISCTPAFTSLCGPIGDGSQLKDWIVDSNKFMQLTQLRVNEFILQQDLGEVVLRTPTANSAGIEYVIHECTLEAISGRQDEDNPAYSHFALRIRLDHIEQRTQRTHRKKSRQFRENANGQRQKRHAQL